MVEIDYTAHFIHVLIKLSGVVHHMQLYKSELKVHLAIFVDSKVIDLGE